MGIKWYFPIYFGLLILIVMACLAMPSVLSYNIQHDNAINQNPHSVNVTITDTDDGVLSSPYYVFASDGHRYNSVRSLYEKAHRLLYQEVKLTYIVEGYDSNTGCEIRRIKSITPLCVPVACANPCVRTCGCGC